MPNAQGQPLSGEPGYVAPVAQPGVINTEAPAVKQASASTPTATAFTVEPAATVQSRIKGIISEDSPLMQQAEARAAAKMNARGLLNSSQAIGAGQAALYDAALPIAQADAATYARAGEATAAAKNAAELQRANIETSTSQFNVNAANAQQAQLLDNAARDKIAKLQADTTLSVAEKENQTKVVMQRFQLEADIQKINADGTVRRALANTEAAYKVLMQTSAGAADLHKQHLANLAAILQNPDISDKQGALNLSIKQLNDALQLIGDVGNMDLGTYLTFDVADAPGILAPPPPPPPPPQWYPGGQGDQNRGGGGGSPGDEGGSADSASSESASDSAGASTGSDGW